MYDPNTVRPLKNRRSSPPRRYRVVARGNIPEDIVNVVSSTHAAALAQMTAHALGSGGNEQFATELDEAGDGDSTAHSEGEVHHG